MCKTQPEGYHGRTNDSPEDYNLLPCRHIFHLDGETKVLTPERWQTYISLFDECGFEVYETMGRVYVEVEERQMDPKCSSIARIGGTLATATVYGP